MSFMIWRQMVNPRNASNNVGLSNDIELKEDYKELVVVSCTEHGKNSSS